MYTRCVSGLCALALLPGFAAAEDEAAGRMMHAFYGDYPAARESSGTSWQPDSTPMGGAMAGNDELMAMYHGIANGGYIAQSGKRGEDGGLTTSMLSARALHPVEDAYFGMRAMVSADPLNGKEGYPLLLQTGETADGHTRLIDRQHPHDIIEDRKSVV